MDESCGISGFCIAMEAELQGQARGGGAEGDGNW